MIYGLVSDVLLLLLVVICWMCCLLVVLLCFIVVVLVVVMFVWCIVCRVRWMIFFWRCLIWYGVKWVGGWFVSVGCLVILCCSFLILSVMGCWLGL